MSVTPGSLQVGLDRLPDRVGLPGDGERGQAGFGIVGRQRLDRADLLGERLGDLARVREAQMPEQLMQPRPLLT